MACASFALFLEEQLAALELLPGTRGLGKAFTLFVPIRLLS